MAPVTRLYKVPSAHIRWSFYLRDFWFLESGSWILSDTFNDIKPVSGAGSLRWARVDSRELNGVGSECLKNRRRAVER